MSSVRILTRWGPNSCLVNYDGKYRNTRPPHIAIQREFTGGEVFRLGPPYYKEHVLPSGVTVYTVMRPVIETDNEKDEEIAHFTVYHGASKPVLSDWRGGETEQ